MKEATMQIEEGACYRDSHGITRRVVAMHGDGTLDADSVPSAGQRIRWTVEDFAHLYTTRVPDPTPAVIDDVLEAGEEYQRQERVDATARAIFVHGDARHEAAAYEAADALEAARKRYIAARKGAVKP